MSNEAKIREEAKKLNPIDDIMFRKMAEESSFCEEILRVIMNDSGLIVLKSHAQWVGQNLQGRSVILDAKCQLSNGKVVNIEFQKANDDNHQKRVGYNGAILTTNITDTGSKFENVPDVCIVFISKFDVFNSGYSLYNIDRIVRQTGEVVNNGFEEIYVSACVKDGSDVSELMDIFTNDESYNVNKYPVTSNIKKRYKQTKEGQSVMCEIMERIEQDGRKEERERINKLILILTQSGRTDDLVRAASDPDYQEQLLNELVPEEE